MLVYQRVVPFRQGSGAVPPRLPRGPHAALQAQGPVAGGAGQRPGRVFSEPLKMFQAGFKMFLYAQIYTCMHT
jgi:hypothetical protein